MMERYYPAYGYRFAIHVGKATVCATENGMKWALPGGRFTDDKATAQRVAKKMNELMSK